MESARRLASVPETRPSRSIFLLSPANSSGKRAQLLLRENASSPLAMRVRVAGAPLGEVFSFLSGLYFRGKLAYGVAFSRSANDVLVIAPGRGLVAADTIVTLADLEAMAKVPVAADNPRFRDPLDRDVTALADNLGEDDVVILLGSIATDKYVEVLQRRLGGRLRFPSAFVGRGDMSRGGLMLRCVSAREELEYVPLAGAVRRGPRPPRLEPLR